MAHLYVMTRSDAPGLLKIGRSSNPERRAQDLHGGHCFHVNVLCAFPQAGHIETPVHHALVSHRVAGPGREWFRLSVARALAKIGELLDSTCPPSQEGSMDSDTTREHANNTAQQEKVCAKTFARDHL